MVSLLGVSRSNRNKAVESAGRASTKTLGRTVSGFKQLSSESHVVKSAHEAFKIEASFENQGVYPLIRSTFIVSTAVMCVLVFVRFFLIPESLHDPDDPIKIGEQHEYWTLVSHFVPSMFFLFGVLLQKESVQKVAKNARYLKYHRIVGRIAALSSMFSSVVAWRITPYSMHGTWMAYVPWNAFWNLASFNTLWYARKKDFSRHRLWANVLVQTAFLFVTTRLFIVVGLILGLPGKPVYVVSVNSASFLAIFWYLQENAQWSRTIATRRRWAMLRAAFRSYLCITKTKRLGFKTFVCSPANSFAPEKGRRVCYGCSTEIAPDCMTCENARCGAFNDSSQGEYAQLLMDTNNDSTSMSLLTSIERLGFNQKSDVLSQGASLVCVPFLVVYIWMALPLTYTLADGTSAVSFDAVVGWHMVYTFICIHMAASIFKCFPTKWKPMADPSLHLSSSIWNLFALLAALVDAIFLYYCKAKGFWINKNPTWIISLVVSFIPLFLSVPFLTDKEMPRRTIRALLSYSLIVLPLMGYVGSTIASFTVSQYINSDDGSSSFEIILGIMVVLQLYEEILCQLAKGMIDVAKREFGLDESTLPPKERTKEQDASIDNLETLFVFQDFIFGAYFFCFYRELWTVFDSTIVCVILQVVLLLQDFNMIFGGTVLRSVRVIVEGPIISSRQKDPREELTSWVPEDRRASALKNEFFIRISNIELTDALRALSMKLLIRLISLAATPLFGLICRFGPNSSAFPSWSKMDDVHFVAVLKNFGIMILFEILFVTAIVTSLYSFFRMNLLNLLTSALLRSPLTRFLFACSCVHLLQDLYVAILALPQHW